MTDIAIQYALAVFSLASEQKEIKELGELLHDFVDDMEAQTKKFFTHPKISLEEKKAVIENTFKDQLLIDFLKVIIDNNRFSLLPSIDMAYQDLVNNMDKVMEVKIYTNKKLTKANIEKLKAKISDKYQRKVVAEEIIDESIIGGVRLEYEGAVLDNTVNRYLKDLRSTLKD